MKKLIWIMLGAALLAGCWMTSPFVTGAFSADPIIVNGKVGTVIADKPILDTSFYKLSDKSITDTILMGRAIVDAHRGRVIASWTMPMTQEDRYATNITRLAGMRAKLSAWGFKDESDLLKISQDADKKAGLKEAGWWK